MTKSASRFALFLSLCACSLPAAALGWSREQLVVGYVDPQYNLTIALVAMLILIGWRSRAELAV